MKQSSVFDHSGNAGQAFASLTICVFGLSSAIPITAPLAPTPTIFTRHRHSNPPGTQPAAWPKPFFVTSPTGTERFNPHNRYPAA
jgi:hypothetical protein